MEGMKINKIINYMMMSWCSVRFSELQNNTAISKESCYFDIFVHDQKHLQLQHQKQSRAIKLRLRSRYAGEIWKVKMFSVHTKKKRWHLQIPLLWRAFSKSFFICDGLMWTEGQTVERQLRFQISPAASVHACKHTLIKWCSHMFGTKLFPLEML